MSIILASASPRRTELLTFAKIDHHVEFSNIEEVLDPNLSPVEQVQLLSKQKAEFISKIHPETTIIGADTIVVLDNEILGKPVDKKDAFQTLKKLSGHTHEVLTAVCIINKKKNIHEIILSKTEVEFFKVDDAWITNYIDSGEPMDKAGSYGIQDSGFELVKKINGDYYSVVGLPISQVKRVLKDLKII